MHPKNICSQEKYGFSFKMRNIHKTSVAWEETRNKTVVYFLSLGSLGQSGTASYESIARYFFCGVHRNRYNSQSADLKIKIQGFFCHLHGDWKLCTFHKILRILKFLKSAGLGCRTFAMNGISWTRSREDNCCFC